jgi:ribosome-associated protein
MVDFRYYGPVQGRVVQVDRSGSDALRITLDGVIVIKAQTTRSQDKNRAEAIARLHEMVALAAKPVKPRRATRPTLSSQRKRVDSKVIRGQTKATRGKVEL